MVCKFLNAIMLAAIFLIWYPEEGGAYPYPSIEIFNTRPVSRSYWGNYMKRMADSNDNSVVYGDDDVLNSPSIMDGNLGGVVFGPEQNAQEKEAEARSYNEDNSISQQAEYGKQKSTVIGKHGKLVLLLS